MLGGIGMTTLASEASSDALYLLHEGMQYQSYHLF